MKIKCRTDHKGLESGVQEDLDRIGGPLGWRSRWRLILARLPL